MLESRSHGTTCPPEVSLNLMQSLRSCGVFLLVQVLVWATWRSKANGLFPPNAECRRHGLLKRLMYWKMAVSAWRRVCQGLCQINSALIVLKKVSTAALAIFL